MGLKVTWYIWTKDEVRRKWKTQFRINEVEGMDCCCCIGKMDQFPLFNLNFDQTSSNSKIVRQCFSTFQKKIQYLGKIFCPLTNVPPCTSHQNLRTGCFPSCMKLPQRKRKKKKIRRRKQRRRRKEDEDISKGQIIRGQKFR